MEFNNNFFIFTGLIGSCTVLYFIYVCLKKNNNRNIINIDIPENPLEYSLLIENQTESQSIPSQSILSNNIIHQNPIPPPYQEIDEYLIPPPYKE